MKKITFTLFILGLSLNACSASPLVQYTSSACIPPMVATIPSNMSEHRATPETDISSGSKEILSSGWSIQPDDIHPFQENVKDESLSAATVSDGTIWVALSNRILSYNPNTGKTHSYGTKNKDNQPFVFYDIIVTKDGELWALVFRGKQVSLTHYNIQNDQFELVPAFNQIGYKGNSSFLVASQILAETSDGNLLMPIDKNIIVYDPKQKIIHYLLPITFKQDVAALVVSGEKVWFTVGQDHDLRNVDLQTGEITNYHSLPSIVDEPEWKYSMGHPNGPIAVDSQGTVWKGYFTMLKKDQNGQYTWEQVSYPPELIYENEVDPYADKIEYQYRWSDIHAVHTFSDGSLWFNAYVGIVQFNPKKNVWCKKITTPFTSHLPAIAEDAEGNVWVAIIQDQYLNIYKYNKTPLTST